MASDVLELFTLDNAVALAALTGLEIVLGIDNVVFIAILAGKLPAAEQPKARRIGLLLAMVMRILLLLAIGWVMGLTRDLFGIPKFWTSVATDVHGISGRDLIMLLGGLFLIAKATYELHDKLEGDAPHERSAGSSSFAAVIVQIVLIDMVFSLDSVITAVGMVSASVEARWIGLSIMITAVVISIGVMLAFAGAISRFVAVHPTLKVLALSFLILIGVMLVAEGAGAHFPKGYVYFAMAFSLLVELMNMRLRKVSKPVTLQQSYVRGEPQGENVYQTGAAALGPKRQAG